MKDFAQKLLPMTIAGSLFLGACNGPTNFTKNNYSVTPDPLEMKGDSVLVTINGNVPPKSIGKKSVVTFQPYLKTADGGEIKLKEITVKGPKAKANADQTIDSKLGGKITYTDKIPYTANMRSVKLLPRFTYEGKLVPVAGDIMVQGTIATAGLVTFKDEVYMIGDNYKPELSNKSVAIYFPMDVAKFNPNFKQRKLVNNKGQIAELKKLLMKDPNWVIRGISINATASPDGELSRNNDLSKGRSETTFAYFKKELKKLGFTEANDSNFAMGYMLAEDWKGFAAELANSDFADKNEMLAIVNNTSISDEEREGLLRRNHEASWKIAADKILPKLRRSELVLLGAKPFKTEADLAAYYGKYEQLSNDELYHLAIISSDEAKKVEALNAYNARNNGEWKGFCELAAVQIKQGKLDDASANLNTADGISPKNGKVLANKAAIARAKGDLAGSEALYMEALNAGENTYYNLGLFAIKKGNYPLAVSCFQKSGKSDFNSALATLLNGDANGAKTAIDNMDTDKLTWDLYYLRAVCGARLNSQDVVTTNIARAVSLDAKARTLAKDDMEFRSFFNNPLFEAATR
jgi:hypothetical protein